ncbi:glycosyltransferase family 4 protein [Propionibacteriaceae bacterium G1746]|uniref:glycosyltransferase family 4 protein n=1 Tax=Aestuariimicrobium sp. G57 TaxID=3418485 RepID=UPI003C27BE87
MPHRRPHTGESPHALWIVPVSNLAGVARHVIDVAHAGLPGWTLTVAAPEGPLLDELRALGATPIPLAIEPGVPVRRAVAALRHAVHDVRPTLVHTHLARADLLAAMAAPGTATGAHPKLVSTEHHIPPNRYMFHKTWARAKTMETIHHWRLKRFHGLVAVSESTKQDMLTYWRPGREVTVIHNGVDRPANPPRREPGYRFLSLARLSPEKNIEMTLRAFSRIVRDVPQARLTVAGTGDHQWVLKRLAAALRIDEAVSFPGFVDANEALASHDVVLQPSLSDNFSYTLLDAMAHGLGVAASPIGGNPEMLPERCIADFDDVPGFAEIAIEQAELVDRRPTLPDSVPTVAQMCARITAKYAQVLG